jgi:hypothetical protein
VVPLVVLWDVAYEEAARVHDLVRAEVDEATCSGSQKSIAVSTGYVTHTNHFQSPPPQRSVYFFVALLGSAVDPLAVRLT